MKQAHLKDDAGSDNRDCRYRDLTGGGETGALVQIEDVVRRGGSAGEGDPANRPALSVSGRICDL